MGIQGLSQFLKKYAPELDLEIPISCISGQRVAVDASVYLYKFICIDNKLMGNWLDLFIDFIVWLRKNNIRPIFVFDGKPPIQKERTQQTRRDARSKIKDKISELENILEKLNEIEDDKIDDELKVNIIKYIDNYEDWCINDMKIKIYSLLKKENSKCIIVSNTETFKVQSLLTLLGIPWLNAVGEAEKSCSWLCEWGYVKGVITADSDVLAYGVPIFIKDIKIGKNICKIIRTEDILTSLNLSFKKFQDFCILCGTDYNKRIPGIGPITAFHLINTYDCLEELSKDYDTSILNYKEVRNLFILPNKDEPEKLFHFKGKFKIPTYKTPNKGELLYFLLKINSKYTPEDLLNYAYKSKFIVI